MKAVKLTLRDRFDLMFHIARLPSTISLRTAYDGLMKAIDFTPDEIKTFDITPIQGQYGIATNEDTQINLYTIDVLIHNDVVDVLKAFVEAYDTEQHNKVTSIKIALDIFKKII